MFFGNPWQKRTAFSRLALVLVIILPQFSNAMEDQEIIYSLGAKLNKLARVTESIVYFDPAARSLSDEELLALSAKENPNFISWFSGYIIRFNVKNRHVSVLLCTSDYKALIEDIGCTSTSDLHIWKQSSTAPCTFTLPLKKLCRRPK